MVSSSDCSAVCGVEPSVIRVERKERKKMRD